MKKLYVQSLTMLLTSIVLFFFGFLVEPIKENKNEYKTIAVSSDINLFKEETKENIIKLLTISKDKNIIYLGKINEENSLLIDLLNELSNTYYIDKISYIDIDNEKEILSYKNEKVTIEKEGTAFYNKLLEKLGSFTEVYALKNKYGEPINSKHKTIYTPMILFMNDGIIEYSYYLKEEIDKKTLNSILTEGFEMIKG